MAEEFGICIRCGRRHPAQDVYDIAQFCLAVKSVKCRGYVYDSDGHTVSHPGIESIEYFDPDQQKKLFEEALKLNEH